MSRAYETVWAAAKRATEHKSNAVQSDNRKGSGNRPDDSLAERRWNRVREEVPKLPGYQQEALRLLLKYSSLTDYTALQKLGQLGRANSLASVLPGLQNQTGLIRPVPGQPPTRQPEYETHYEIAPELRQFVERYFNQKA